MTTIAWIATVLYAATNLAAVVGLVRGLRSERPSRHAIAAFCAAGLVIVVAVVSYVVLIVGAFPGVADVVPSQKAARLAQSISEAMNCAVFGGVAAIVPMAVGVVLLAVRPRSQRKRS